MFFTFVEERYKLFCFFIFFFIGLQTGFLWSLTRILEVGRELDIIETTNEDENALFAPSTFQNNITLNQSTQFINVSSLNSSTAIFEAQPDDTSPRLEDLLNGVNYICCGTGDPTKEEFGDITFSVYILGLIIRSVLTGVLVSNLFKLEDAGFLRLDSEVEVNLTAIFYFCLVCGILLLMLEFFGGCVEGYSYFSVVEEMRKEKEKEERERKKRKNRKQAQKNREDAKEHMDKAKKLKKQARILENQPV
eukprot:snap_masked-scaffold_10-processed-gene-8.17-mRNA-1 protein AED:1.00 eAED:1.00 QI:0/0/0/0/1/1/2/0/248